MSTTTCKKKQSKQSLKPPCAVWDFTAWCSRVGEDPRAFYTKIKAHFKSAEWSLEKAPSTGALHFQGRGSLFKKIREGPGSAQLANSIGLAYFMPSSNKNTENTNYQQKAESHVAGPWSILSPPPLKVSDVSYIEENMHALPFLTQLIEWLKGPVDPRIIWWVFDHVGNSRKSSVLAYLTFHGLIEVLPFVDNHKDLLQFAHGFAHKKAYAVNVARGCAPKDDKQRKEFASFIAGLESLKDGFVYDIRNTPKKDQMERPHLLVFANCKPIFDAATRDRWLILRVTSDMRFEDITGETLEEHDTFMEDRRRVWDQKEAMQTIRHKRKWEAFIGKNPGAKDFIKDREDKRRQFQIEKEKMMDARDRYFALQNTPLAIAWRGAKETYSNTSDSGESISTATS